MLHADVPHFFLVSAIFFAAGLVKGVLGMGLPTFAMALLGQLMPVAQAASLLTLPSLLTNLWQGLAGGALPALARRVWSLQIGIAAGVAAAAMLPAPGEQGASIALGLCLLAYGLLGLAGWHPPAPSPRALGPAGLAAGAVTGVITAFTGVFVLPAVPYLQSLRLERAQLAQALGLSFTTSTIALASLLALRGHFDGAASVHSALAVLPALAGMLVGQQLRDAMSEALFRRCFFIGMAALGGWLAVR